MTDTQQQIFEEVNYIADEKEKQDAAAFLFYWLGTPSAFEAFCKAINREDVLTVARLSLNDEAFTTAPTADEIEAHAKRMRIHKLLELNTEERKKALKEMHIRAFIYLVYVVTEKIKEIPQTASRTTWTTIPAKYKQLAKNAANLPKVQKIPKKTALYSTIRQGTATNDLAKIKAVDYGDVVITKDGTAIATRNNFTLTLANFDDLKGFKTTTKQLFDALIIRLTEDGAKTPQIEIPLKEYMKQRGLKNEKEAREQVKNDLKTISKTTISYLQKGKGGRIQNYEDINITSKTGIVNGVIRVKLAPDFFGEVSQYPFMQYPNLLLQLNSKRNPNSFYFLRKLAEHKAMNKNKPNENIIAVKTLLEASPEIPTKEEATQAGRHFTQSIMNPFERDMDALTDTLTWHYCKSKGENLTDEELDDLNNYDTFEKALIKVAWKEEKTMAL